MLIAGRNISCRRRRRVACAFGPPRHGVRDIFFKANLALGSVSCGFDNCPSSLLRFGLRRSTYLKVRLTSQFSRASNTNNSLCRRGFYLKGFCSPRGFQIHHHMKLKRAAIKAALFNLVPKAGFEPARVAPLPPQDSVSTSSTTSASSIKNGPQSRLSWLGPLRVSL